MRNQVFDFVLAYKISVHNVNTEKKEKIRMTLQRKRSDWHVFYNSTLDGTEPKRPKQGKKIHKP